MLKKYIMKNWWFIPNFKLTEEQSKALEKKLNNDENSEYKCFIVMRCWHPRAEDCCKSCKKF